MILTSGVNANKCFWATIYVTIGIMLVKILRKYADSGKKYAQNVSGVNAIKLFGIILVKISWKYAGSAVNYAQNVSGVKAIKLFLA
jgi:hypothetical protein